TAQVGLISTADGSFQALKSMNWRGITDGTIHFSPDGKYLGYSHAQSDNSRQNDLFVLNLDGASEISVAADPSDDRMVGWSPDGRWILFTSDRAGSTDLYAIAFAGGKPQ